MKKLLGFAFGAAVLCLLTACSQALYSDVKTEEVFRMIPSAALRDHKIKTTVYDYELSGETDFTGLRISMKEDGKLNLRYTGKDGQVTEFRLNGQEAAVYEPGSGVFEPADPEVTLALRFFYEMNFIGPEYMAKYISLVNRVPEKLDGEGPLCYEFEIVPKEDFHLKSIHLFTDAKQHFVRRILYDRSHVSAEDEDEEITVTNSFRDVMIRDGIAVPVLVESDFLGNKYTMKLKSFSSNMPVSDSLFELTKEGFEKSAAAETAKKQAPIVKAGEKTEIKSDAAAEKAEPEQKSEAADKAGK
ncbi:MAG: hypothetical protein J5944_14555 [Lentisphaeria bacterium]|nr:hypothetical protein [Lentisphaeria bacterium]